MATRIINLQSQFEELENDVDDTDDGDSDISTEAMGVDEGANRISKEIAYQDSDTDPNGKFTVISLCYLTHWQRIVVWEW